MPNKHRWSSVSCWENNMEQHKRVGAKKPAQLQSTQLIYSVIALQSSWLKALWSFQPVGWGRQSLESHLTQLPEVQQTLHPLPQRWHSQCPPHHPHGSLRSTDSQVHQAQTTHNHPPQSNHGHQAIAAVVDQLVEKPLASPEAAWEPHLPMPHIKQPKGQLPKAKHWKEISL